MRAAATVLSPVGRALGRAVAASLLATWLVACGGDGGSGPSATPASVRLQAGSAQTGTVGSALAIPLSVVVTDKSGGAVSGARVDWDVGAGSGTLAPASTLTNSAGVAQTTWTLGTVAGNQRATAQVSGLTRIVFTATALPGAAASVVATPHEAYLGVGDTIRLIASARDQYGNVLSGQAITFRSADAAIAGVDVNGLITAIAQGAGRVIVEAGGRSDTVAVTVGVAGSSACGPLPVQTLALGQVISPVSDAAGIRVCLASPAGVNAEYALTLISTVESFSTITSLDVYGFGNTGPATAALMAPAEAGTAFESRLAEPVSLTAPRRVEWARREVERTELAPLVSGARAWQAEKAASPSLVIPTNIKVGDAITFNANATSACSSPDNRASRVAAIGAKSIVVVDNENPTGGYTDAEYADIAATFDTLIYPLDTTAFGAPTNVSGTGKIVLFYTARVNALTPASTSNFTVGGFFFARDLYPKTARNGLGACAASNEAEMFYLLVPDPNGTINGNRRTKSTVTTLNLGTIAHEFEHLINSGRRLYVNTSATPNEEIWLDEGLAHSAEELLYYRMSGFTSRQNLNLQQVASQSTLFSNYAGSNFSRFYTHLISPETSSPYAPNDSLSTRGATWSFLRYAAGRQGAGGEAAFYRALVNSSTSGRANLANVLGGSTVVADYLRDWTVSLIADDYSTAVTAALNPIYVTPSWNFRSIYPGLTLGGGSALGVYPIATRSLTSGVPQRISLAGGTSSYVRFGIRSGQSALLSVASNGGAIPSGMRYAIVRMR